MSFFENFTEKAKLYANIAAEKAKDVAEVAADKAKDVKETAQLTLAIRSEQRELDKNFRAIGQWFASEYQGETPDAIKIAEMEAALAEKSPANEACSDDEMPQMHVCPVCGTATNSRFCPECGAEVVPAEAAPAAEEPAQSEDFVKPQE